MKTAIEIAREAGAGIGTSGRWLMTHTELELLVTLVRADEREKWEGQTAVEVHEAVLDEREACAKLCDDLDDDIVDGLAGWQYGDAIRARGQA